MTVAGAAEIMGCSIRTVTRAIGAGTLKRHTPRHGKHERPPILLWYSQVQQLQRARQLVRGGERAPEA